MADEIQQITQAEVLELLRYRSSRGVVSVYLDAAREAPHEVRRWESALHSGLHGLKMNHRNDRALDAMLVGIRHELKALPPDAYRRGLVFFYGSEPPLRVRKTLQLPVGTHFVFMDRPYVRPLIELLDESPRIGVIIISSQKVRFLTWSQGILEEVGKETLEIDDTHWRDYVGGGQASAGSAQVRATHTDDYESRVDAQVRRFLKQVAERAVEAGKAQSWRKLAMVGEPSVVADLQRHLPVEMAGQVIGALDRNLTAAPAATVGRAVAERLDAGSADRKARLVEEILQTAAAGRRAVLGPAGVLDALAERRAERLVYVADLNLEGWRLPGGAYTVNPASGDAVEPEPLLVERMIEMAFESNGRVTPVDGPAAARLEAQGGIAACLRW